MKIITIFLLLSLVTGLKSQTNQVWDYPIKPGTERWKQLKNHKEKVDVCQIPDSILANLSTNDLIEICLQYPLLIDILAFNNTQDGVNKIKSNFNGFNELLNRNESGKLLIKKYSKIDPLDIDESWSYKEIGALSFKCIMFELFLSQHEIIQKLDIMDKKTLVKELLKKQERICNRKDIYGGISHMSIAFTMSRIVWSEKDSNNFYQGDNSKLSKFIKQGTFHDQELLPDILLIGSEFAK